MITNNNYTLVDAILYFTAYLRLINLIPVCLRLRGGGTSAATYSTHWPDLMKSPQVLPEGERLQDEISKLEVLTLWETLGQTQQAGNRANDTPQSVYLSDSELAS